MTPNQRAPMPIQHPHVRAGIMHPPSWPQNGSFAQSSLLWPESCHRAAENAGAQIKALLKQACFALAMARCTSRSVTATSSQIADANRRPPCCRAASPSQSAETKMRHAEPSRLKKGCGNPRMIWCGYTQHRTGRNSCKSLSLGGKWTCSPACAPARHRAKCPCNPPAAPMRLQQHA